MSSFTTSLSKVLFIFCLLLALRQEKVSAVPWPWSWNKVDKQELRHGKWRVYHGSNPKQVHYKGRYRHGKEWGRWKTYTPDGLLYFKERFIPKSKVVITTYYHPNGKISHQGIAHQYETQAGIWNFYWEGEWKFYDSTGAFLGNKMFVKGNATTPHPVLPPPLLNK